MEKTLQNSNLLTIIVEFLELYDVLASIQASRMWKKGFSKDSIWWPLYHRRFLNIRILDRNIGTSALAAYKACNSRTVDLNTSEMRPHCKYTISILGMLG
jgi:hypothetical protein